MGLRCAVATPIMVEGRLWGAMITGTSGEEPLPLETESRLGQFTELIATAIANAEARGQVERLAEVQAALRRVAMLVARQASQEEIFTAIAKEVRRFTGAEEIRMMRYEDDGAAVAIGGAGEREELIPIGTRVPLGGNNVTTRVWRTREPVRIDNYPEAASGPIAELTNPVDVRSGVGAPIVVEGRLWGVTVANWTGDERPPPDTEQRMAQFTELLGTAIANADSRDQLTASRARLLTAADEARRRVVRDLHDGAQQRLVHTIVTLNLARQALRSGDGEAGSLVDEALDHAGRGNEELRELAHGIHPSALTRGGLRGGVRTVVERLDLPVDVDVLAERLPPEIEASAYFIVAEALTNVVKHSQAAHAEVTASVRDGMLDVQVRDDGIGGADPDGHGLVGMKDRVAALGGRFEIASPPDGGTCVAATLPLAQAAFADSL
jgi:signal transduction histidine kinase